MPVALFPPAREVMGASSAHDVLEIVATNT